MILHATTVALGEDRGLLILGPSGSGKSGLALQLIALGAQLVADDRTTVHDEGGALIATCPPALRGRIEARAVGILNAPHLPRARLILAVDLGQTETERLPPRRSVTITTTPLDLVLGSASSHLPSALLCYLLHGRGA
ncbi:MAG: serine kinase [Rhodobacteraceae bacterium]|nr:serine kinase [Paracoccaceae bacterium]